MNSCKNCSECKQVYRIFKYRFFRFGDYYCTARDEIINQPDGVCDKWKKKKAESDLSAQRFEDVINDIQIIKQHLKNSP